MTRDLALHVVSG